MFKIGDKVVYPMYGAGIIDAIEDKEIMGEIRQYYLMRMPVGDMRVMIPTDNVEAIGIRDIVAEEVIDNLFYKLTKLLEEETVNWNQRYRANMDKVKTGDIYSVGEVVISLMMREQERGLSTGERKMLENARQIMVSELVLVKKIDEDQANQLIKKCLANNKNASI